MNQVNMWVPPSRRTQRTNRRWFNRKCSPWTICFMGLSTILLVIASCLVGVLILLRGDLTKRLAHMHSITTDPIVREIGPLIKRGDLTAAAQYLLNNHTNDTINFGPSTKHFRLNRQVIPIHYSLLIHPRLSLGDFAGFVNVSIRLTKPRSIIWMHAGMDFVRVLSFAPDEGTVELDDSCGYGFRVIRENDAVALSLRCVLRPGNYTINMAFGGWMGSEFGLMRSKYTDGDVVRYIASTKFEPTYARLAFPCFDEPDLKATYDVQLVRPTVGYIALSNMDVKSERPHDNPEYTVVSFNRSQRMSTYLAVFVVCDFTYLSEKTVGNTSVRVYARESQKNNTKEALNLTAEATQYYSDYFGISYPLPKLDLIAIPDFVSGAMENWGLITFRETSLLFDPELNSAGNRQSVSITVAHEIAHMWFGDLVTMKWWTDLWLNEGFATFMEYKALHHVHPKWDVESQFLVDELQSVLTVDADLSSHPVLQEVGHPDQITSIFDSISYNKGASVIRMLESFMGKDNFRKGLKKYLEKHMYANAATVDLWDALGEQYQPDRQSKKTIGAIMDTWTRQEGFPLVTVKRTEKNTYILTQKRFLSDPTAKFDVNKSPFKYRWEIPVTYITSEAPKNSTQVFLWSDIDSVIIKIPDNTQWIKFNHEQVGFYRVQYDKDDWQILIKLLNTSFRSLESSDRASLLNDAFSLADAKELDYEVALDMIGYLKQEEAYVPWSVGADITNNLLKYLPDLPELKKYFRDLVQDAYKKFTWEVGAVDDHLTRRARVVVLDIACNMRLEDALNTASKLFMGWLDNNQPIAPDLRVIVYQYGMANTTDEKVWDRVFEKYLTVVNTQDKVKLMYSLAKTPNKELLKKYLELAKDESKVRGQDYFTVLTYIANNPAGTQLVWDFYRDNYDYLVDRFSLNSRVLGKFILQFARFHTKEKLEEMQSFFAKYSKAGAGESARKQALESVSTNIKWMEWNSQKVTDWFKTRYQ